ncbi:hypothetical protein [Roseovarius mucosus]|nr:hypothetical protein [Roseovarius mucosus]
MQQETADGPLNDTQIQQFAADFDLPRDSLRKLSSALGGCLSGRIVSRGILKVVKQMEMGPSELEKLIKELRQAQVRLSRASALYSEIEVQYPKVGRSKDNPNIVFRLMLENALRDVSVLSGTLARAAVKYGVHFTGEPDKRRNRDYRRTVILGCIFDTWHAADKNVSLTTNSVTSERTGPLVDFTNAIVRCITDPVSEIKGETIWKEVQGWREHQESKELYERLKLEEASVSTTDK